MTRRAGTVRIAITQAQILHVLIWLDTPPPPNAHFETLRLFFRNHVTARLGGVVVPRVFFDNPAARAQTVRELRRLLRWPRTHATLSRSAAAYLGSLSLAAYNEQQPIPLEVADSCLQSLRKRGRPSRTKDQLQAGIDKLAKASQFGEGDDRELRRLKRLLKFEKWRERATQRGETFLTSSEPPP